MKRDILVWPGFTSLMHRTGRAIYRRFTLGRFVSFTADGCPDGSLQISEADRPVVGGSWCGTSWGAALYYSETRSVSLSLRLTRLARDQTGYNFDYRMGYKMLPKAAAIVRYGGALPGTLHTVAQPNTTTPTPLVSAPPLTEIPSTSTKAPPTPPPKYYLGDLMAGTYCSRIFSDCDRKACRLQSPNFPGIYPRNLTCYYAVRQHDVPPGKQALIAVRQPKGQLDYVTVYDGYTTRDAVLLKFCGGGEAVPEAVSSGPELLVEFTSSPYGTFLYPAPLQALHGFQLEVQVRFVDQQSPTYARNKRCEFWVRGTNKGTLETPQHSLPRNTTCLYHLQGIDITAPRFPPEPGFWRREPPPPRYRVWLSILKVRNASYHCNFNLRSYNLMNLSNMINLLQFHVSSTIDPQLQEEEECASQLKVWDGMLRVNNDQSRCNDIFWCIRRVENNFLGGSAVQWSVERRRFVSLRVHRGELTHVKKKKKKRALAYSRSCVALLCLCPRSDNINEKDKLTRIPTVLSASGGSRLFMGPSEPANATLLATYCKDQVPRSCDHSLLANSTRSPRPCSLAESFLSSGDSLSLELRLAESTALRPVSFRALYEFVDLHQDGEPYGSGPCSRKFVSRSQGPVPETPQKFQNPKNVFLYGRGGSPNIRQRLSGASGEIRFKSPSNTPEEIRITRLQTGGRRCPNARQPDLGRFQCHANCTASLRIYDQPWTDTPPLARDCLCTATPNFTFVSTAHVVEVRFVVLNMNASDDFRNFNFEGSWEFIRTPVCPRRQRLSGASGEIRFKSPSNTPEEGRPGEIGSRGKSGHLNLSAHNRETERKKATPI
ncbi:hypothetical protein C0J52_22225 [Blattella germanica]|nr:hypothetical protein C0J52_22225 [Blattella germanica]